MANNRKNPWELTEEQQYEFQQAYRNARTAEEHIQEATNAQTIIQSLPGKLQIPQWSERRIAMQNYRDALRNYNLFIGIGGESTPAQDAKMQSLYDQYNKSWEQLNGQIQANYMAYQFPGLAEQAEQLSRERGMEITPARLMGQMGLVDANGNLTEAGQTYWQRGAYQQGITDAREKQTQWGEQALQLGEDVQTAQDWIKIVQNLPQTDDARITASNQQWMQQAAEANGITQWSNREDLLQQLQAKEGRAQRMGETPVRLAQQGAVQERGYQGALYRLDHPDVSLDGAYYLSEAEKYEAKKRERWLHGDLWNGTVAWARENRARDSYAQINYDETKRETLGQIMADPALGQAYQSAQKMTWDLRTVEYLDEYIQGAMNTNGVLTADDIGQIRLVALQNGIDLPEDDAQIRQEVNRMMREYSGQLETDLAELEAAGYDRAQLLDYMERDIDAAEMREYNAQNRAAAEEHGVGMSLASSVANLVSGTGYISAIPQSVENLWATLTGNYDAYAPINTNSKWFRAGSFVKEVRDEVSQNLAEQYPDGTFMGQNTASFLYGTGMSMLDNIVQMAVGAAMFSGAGSLGGAIAAGSPVTLGTMGLSAATNDLIQLTNEGTPAGQAMLLSTLRGGLEILTEKIGIDMLVSNMGRQQMGNLVKQIAASMLRQGAAEGAEEAIAEVGGDLADVLVRADESEMRQAIAQGMASGMTEKEAFIQYIMDLGKRTVAATAGGFLSGLGFGGGAVATNLAADSNTARGKTVLNNRTLPQLQQQAGFYGVDASGITEDSTARDIGRVHRQVERAARGAEEELLQFARSKKYTQDGIQALQHAYAEYSSTGAGKMSPQEFAISFDTAYQHGQSDAQYNAEGSYLERAAKDGLTAGLTPGTIAYAYHSGVAAIKRTLTAKTQTTKQGVKEKKNAARAAQTAKTANVMQVERISEHDAVLVMPDGTRQNITTMDTRGTAAQIVSEAMDDGYSTVVVNQMLKNFDGKMDPGEYYEQFRSAMLAGIEGESLSQAKKAADQLPAAVAKEAHDRGRLLGKAYDLADRIGNAGKYALQEYGYAAPAEFEKFYKAGLEGKSFRQAEKELGKVSDQIKDEMQAAVKSGLRDKQGGFEYGRQERGTRSNQESGRVRGMGTGESAGQAGSMAETESGGESQTDREAAAGNESQTVGTREEKVSSKALGLQYGTDRATLKVIDPAQYTEEQRKIADQYAQQDISVTFVLGPIEIRQTDGSAKKAHGVAVGQRNQIIVRADTALSMEQIAAHEAKHIEYARYPDRIAEDWKRFADVQNEEDLDRWIAGYAERYGYLEGYYGIDQFIEEALCDVTADVSAPVVSEAYYQEAFKPMAQKWRSEKATNLSEGAGYAKQADSGRVSYQLEPYTDKQIADWRLSKKIIIYKNDDQLMEFVKSVLAGENLTKKMYFGKVAGDLAERIKRDTGLDLSNRNVTLKAENIRKILLHSHGNEQKEAARGQRAVKTEDFRKIVDIIGQPDEISRSNVDYKGRPVIRFEKTEDKTLYTIIAVDSGGSLDLYVQTMYIGIKKGSIFNVTNANALIITPETSVGTAPNISVREDAENVKADLYSIDGPETSAEQSDTMDNAPRYMVAGRWAEYADSGQLARAEELENKGASTQKILKETGWYRGADGQWRFEIDDSVMRYKRPLPSLLKRTNGQVLLKDILYHPDLFANYPFLNKVKVIFMQMPEGQRGSYNPYTATVKLNVSLLHGPEATLLHELQHAIQEFEGFAGGAYQGYWRKKKLTGYIETMKVRELENKIMEFSMDPKTRDAAAMWHRMQEVKEDTNALKELKKEAARDGLTMKIAKFQSLQDQRAKAAAEFVDRDSYDLYRNTAGEVEARTTAERQYMTESERRNNLHFVGDKNTVFADVFGEPMDSEQMDMEAEPTAEQQLKTAQQRIKALEGINQHLREQWKLTPQYTPDARQISKAAGMFMKEYAGSWSQKELEGKLAALWKTAQQRTKGEVSFDAMMEQTRKLAAELVQNYLDSGVQDAETIREIKQYVRSTRMYLSPDLRSDLDHYGGYQAVRKANFGRIRLANSGMGVDQVYQELHEQYPAYFPEGIWNPADQLMQIIDVVNDGTQVLQRSPLAMMSDGMDYMTNKILWELGLVKAAPQTKADKILEAAAKVSNRDQVLQAAGAHEQERMDQLEAYYKQQLQKVKNSREDAIQKLKERYRQKAQEQRDWKAEQEVKNKLLYHAAKLKRMSRKTNPEQQRQIQEIFGDINTLCKHMTGFTVVRDYVQGMSTDNIRPEGYQDLRQTRRVMSPEEASLFPDVAGNKVVDTENLKKWYEDQKRNNPDFIADKRIEEILASWDAKQINMMSVQDAQALLDVALNIENEIRTQQQLIDARDRREVYQQVRDVIDDVNSTKGKYDNLLSRGFTGWITESTLSPVRMIQRLTGYHDSDPMYQATVDLQQGEMKMLDYQRRAYEMFKPFTEDRKFMDYLAGKGKQTPITIGGVDERGNITEVKITPDMRVALYLHSQNYQNLRHIQRGGLTVPHYESYVKGKTEEAYDRSTRLRLTPSQVRQITSHMTQREIAYAQRLEKYFNVMSKTEINETSVKLKGYEIAKTNHYYPIETNKEFVVKEFDSLKFDGSLENMGFTKERIEGGNPIMLGNASTTLARSVKQHSMYTGLAIPLRNFNKLRGVSIMASDEAGAVKYQSDSLMDTIRKKWGKSGLDYIEKMVADLSGVKPQQDRGMEVLNKLRSNYAGAVLELNPSTAMKQLIAYPSAASILGWDAMSVGLSKWQKVDVEEVNKYTPLLWHRMQGYIDSDLGDYVSQKKHKPRGLNWNQGVDVAVVKRIWKAAEWKVAHENRALVQDRDAWMKATAELFNQVMLQSQANYTTMQRGQILRTDNVFLRSLAMFKTEPFQSFNVLYDAFANEAAKRRQLEAARQEAERGDDEAAAERVKTLEQDHKAAKQRIGNALPAVLASNLMEALITFAWAFFRGKDEDWEDEETGEITAGSFFKRLGMRTLGNLGGIAPFGAELADLITAIVMGDQYYGIENTETSVIADAMSNAYSLVNTVRGWTEKPEEGEEKEPVQAYDVVLEVLDQGLKLGTLFGLPTENVAKMLKGVTRWTLIAALGEAEGEYWYRRFTSQTTGSGHAKEDLDALYQVLEDGDTEAYERLMNSILRYKDADYVQKALNRRIGTDFKDGKIDEPTAREWMITYGGKDDDGVNEWMRGYIKDLYDEGEISTEQAQTMLTDWTGEDDPDELYWITRGWEYSKETGLEYGRYDAIYDAVWDGEDITAASKELLEHGYRAEQIENQIGE